MGRVIYNRLCAYELCKKPFWSLDKRQRFCCEEHENLAKEWAKPGDLNRVTHENEETKVHVSHAKYIPDGMQELMQIVEECKEMGIQYGEYMRRRYQEYGKYL